MVYLYWLKRLLLLVRVWLCNVAHNMIAHPLIPLLPEFMSNPIHDWTAKMWSNARYAYNHHYLMDEGSDF